MSAILLVEDDTLLGRTLSTYLEKAGFALFWARKSDEVFEALGAQAIDLILLDIMLPGVSGIDILRQIKQMPDKRSIPVVMLTNLSDMTTMNQATDAGALDYIVKANVEFDKLVDLIKTKYLRA
jgi:two-component system phosphate regulon response regulator PhoB